MDRMIYETNFDNELEKEGTENREASKIVLEIPNDLNIYEFYLICKRFAAAKGYPAQIISDVFGEDFLYPDQLDDVGIREHIRELLHENSGVS